MIANEQVAASAATISSDAPATALKLYMWSAGLFALASSEEEAKTIIMDKVNGLSFVNERMKHTQPEVIETARAFVMIGSTSGDSFPRLL